MPTLLNGVWGWRDKAACRDADPEMFFPERGGAGTARRAVRVCADCPVTAECLEEALTLEMDPAGVAQRHGIWGGTTPLQRHRLGKARRRR